MTELSWVHPGRIHLLWLVAAFVGLLAYLDLFFEKALEHKRSQNVLDNPHEGDAEKKQAAQAKMHEIEDWFFDEVGSGRMKEAFAEYLRLPESL